MKLNDIKIDAKKIERGAWIGDVPEMPGVKLKVRGAGNSDFKRLQSKLIGALPRRERRNLSPEASRKIDAQCALETILLDWSGIEDEKGKPLPYSREVAEPFLNDPDFATLLNGVYDAASRVADADEEVVEDIAKNSPTA